VEPPNKGHFGSRAFVLFFGGCPFWWEVRANMQFIAHSRSNIPRQHVLKLRSRLLHRCTTETETPGSQICRSVHDCLLWLPAPAIPILSYMNR